MNSLAVHAISKNSHDPWVGAHTPGCGEAGFAMRSNGKPKENYYVAFRHSWDNYNNYSGNTGPAYYLKNPQHPEM